MSELTIKIGATINGLTSKLAEAKSAISGAFKGLSSIPFLGSLVGGGAIAGVSALTMKLADLGDSIDEGSQRIGVTTDQYQKLGYAAKLSGADISTVETAFKTFSGTIEDAANGSSEAAAKLGRLGLTVADLKGKGGYEQFSRIADALNTIKDSGQRASMAVDIFGKSGMQLIPMLGTFREMGQQLEDLGGVMSTDAIKAAIEFKDAIDGMSAALKGMLANSDGFKLLTANITGAASAMAEIAKARRAAEESGAPKPSIWREYVNNLFLPGRATIDRNNPGINLAPADLPTGIADKKKREADAAARVTNAWNEQVAAEEKKAAAQDAILAKVDRELVQQRMISAGLERQAFIAEKIASLNDQLSSKNLNILTPNQEKIQSLKFGEMYDLRHANDVPAYDAEMKSLREKIEIQSLINQGKEREAAIQQALSKAEEESRRKNEVFTPGMSMSIAREAGVAYDLEQFGNQKQNIMTSTAMSDSLMRVGGTIGGIGQTQHLESIANKQLIEAQKTAVNTAKIAAAKPADVSQVRFF